MNEAGSLPEAPGSILVGDQWQTGVFRTPFARAELRADGWRRYRLKEWHYVSFTTDEWFIAVGLVHLGYVGNLFAYAVDRVQNRRAIEHGEMSPLGRALRIAPSSVRGTTSWKTRNATVSLTARDGWDIELDIPLGSERLRGHARIDERESLAMLKELGPRRHAYTHKAAAWPASGQLELGPRTIRLDGGFGASDWTRSQADRITKWKWASMGGALADGSVIGLNLSADVYDDEAGHSLENALWVDGKVRRLSGVRFDVPAEPKSERWGIQSSGSDEIDITFEPRGAREDHTNFGLVRTDFVQPYGRFAGRVCGRELDGCFGVVETHVSLW
ncbi:MAG: DUF2804 domain-containing protein [Polyangiales bacterium]